MNRVLDSSSITPLYQQLKEFIISQIKNDIWKANEKIMTEAELSSEFGVSRITVRNAISELVDERYLIKKQGKGTFVTPTKVTETFHSSQSFTLNCVLNGIVPDSKLVRKGIFPAGKRDVEELHVAPDDTIVYIERLRFANAEPILLEQIHFPMQYRALLNEDLEHCSLYDVFEKLFGFSPMEKEIEGYHKTAEFTSATKSEAATLGIRTGSPLVLIRESYDGLFWTKQLIIGEKYKIILA